MLRLSVLSLFAVAAGSATAIVVPNASEFAEADGTFSLTSTATAGRTYQMTIAASQLTGASGQFLTSMSFRLNGAAAAAWPVTNASWNDWEIYIGPGVAPGSMSNTFASNFTGAATLVRDGALAINAGAFSSGSSPNAFGPVLDFDTDYLYAGGDLTVEMRFTQQLGATTQAPLDAVLASGGPANGWGVDFSARWTGNFAGTTGSNGNFVVTQFGTAPVPEPGTFVALGLGASLLLVRMRRRAN